MKHICAGLCMILVVAVTTTGYSQASFTFTPLHTSRTDTLGSEIVLDATVTNTSSSSLTLMFVRAVNALPQGWESSMCLDVCYPSTLDTIATTATYGTTPLAPNETRPFSVHVFPMVSQGSATVRVRAVNTRNAADSIGVTFTATSRSTSVTELQGGPSEFVLLQNFPNPFNPTSTIRFGLAQSAHTTLKVYNILGDEIATLVNEFLLPGKYATTLNAQSLASGVYFYTLVSGHNTFTRQLIVLK